MKAIMPDTSAIATPPTLNGPAELVGSMRGSIRDAFTFAHEISVQWNQRVQLRIDKRRSNLPPNSGIGFLAGKREDGPTWNVTVGAVAA